MVDNDLFQQLLQTSRGTAGGELLRQYWQPIGTSASFDGTPQLVRVLGETLVCFRGRSGMLVLLHEKCPHRGASLTLGKVRGDYIECAYHGLCLGAMGRVGEICSARGSNAAVQAKSIPVRELGGLAFCYLGQDEPPPVLPNFDILHWQAGTRGFIQSKHACNYFQVLENLQDPIHTVLLHRYLRKSEYEVNANGALNVYRYSPQIPEITVRKTRFGVTAISTTPVGQGRVYRHDLALCMPNLIRVNVSTPKYENADFASVGQWVVPADDTSTNVFFCAFVPDGARLPPSYLDDWKYFSAITENQDVMITTSQGVVADRTRESLSRSDVAIVGLRQEYLDQYKTLIAGGNLKGRPEAGSESETFCIQVIDAVFDDLVQATAY